MGHAIGGRHGVGGGMCLAIGVLRRVLVTFNACGLHDVSSGYPPVIFTPKEDDAGLFLSYSP